jgi:hypothetical protein
MRPPSRRPLLLVLTAALLGLTAGAGVRYGLGDSHAPAWVAALELSVVDVQLDPAGAHAVLDATVATGETAVAVTGGFATGAGFASGTTGVPVTLVPRPDADVSSPLVSQHRLSVPVHCEATMGQGAEPSRVTLALSTISGVGHEVSAMLGSGLPDLCSFAAGALPAGWEHPLTVAAFTPDPADPRTARLTVSGFDAPGSPVVASFANPSPVADLFTVEQPDSRGAAAVTVHLTDGCLDDGTPIPVGLTVSEGVEDTRTYHYAAVGIPMARWILGYRTKRCRS